jgi:hypothetical protein
VSRRGLIWVGFVGWYIEVVVHSAQILKRAFHHEACSELCRGDHEKHEVKNADLAARRHHFEIVILYPT